MAVEIVRKLVGGVWRTVRSDEGAGGGLPAGGSTGEVLTKESNADGDVGWEAGGGSSPNSTFIAPATDVSTHQDDSFGDVPAFQSPLGPTLTPGQAVVMTGLTGLTMDEGSQVYVEMRILDADGKLIDGVGGSAAETQIWGIAPDGESYLADSNGGVGTEGTTATAFMAIYSLVGGTSQTADSDPYVVGAGGVSYDVIGYAEAVALAAALA